MSVLENIVKVKKLRSGDVILEISPSFNNLSLKNLVKAFLGLLLKIFLPVFSLFDKLAEKRKLVISSVGLGIGLGLSIIVTQRPDTLQAFPVLSSEIFVASRVANIKVPRLNLYVDVKPGSLNSFVDNIVTDDLVHIEGSAFLGQNKPIVVADLSSKNLLDKIENITIGDEIIVVGDNNGRYKYHVSEIRETEAQYLPHVIAKEEDSLIIYKTQDLLRTQLFIVVAKPFK